MGSCLSTQTIEPPVQRYQAQQVVAYPPSGMDYPTVKPSAPPMPQGPPANYMQAYTYAHMPQQQQQQQQQQQGVAQWTPYQYQYQQAQQQYYVRQPQQQPQQPSSGMAFAGGMVAGAVLNSMLDYDDPY